MQQIGSIFAIVIIIFILSLIILKFPTDRLVKVFDTQNLALVITFILFVFILITYLSTQNDWTADLLKVLAGVFLGVVGTNRSNSIKQTAIGREIRQAMGDYIENVEKLQQANISRLEKLSTYREQPSIKVREWIHIKITEPKLQEKFEQIKQDDCEERTRNVIDFCLNNKMIKDQINHFIQKIKSYGWKIDNFQVNEMEFIPNRELKLLFIITKKIE